MSLNSWLNFTKFDFDKTHKARQIKIEKVHVDHFTLYNFFSNFYLGQYMFIFIHI